MALPAYDGPTFSERELSDFKGRGLDAFLEYVRRGPALVRKYNPGRLNITVANEIRSEARQKRLELEELMNEIDRDRNGSPQDHAC
jgi:hypothetical protein